MSESPLYDLAERHAVVFTPKSAEGKAKVWDPVTETHSYVSSPGGSPQPVTLEVFLFNRGQGNGADPRAGFDLNDGRLIMQIVGTEGDDTPLKLPDGVSAGDKGTVTLLGQKGTLEVQARSPAQIPEVSDEMGWMYTALYSTG